MQGDEENESLGDRDENDNDEDDPQEDDDDEDEEMTNPRKRAKKSTFTPRRQSSGSKINGVSKAAKAKKPRKSRKTNISVQIEENTNESPMLGKLQPKQKAYFVEALLDDNVALDTTILEWIERYEEDKTKALAAMVNFVLRVSSLYPPYLTAVLWLFL